MSNTSERNGSSNGHGAKPVADPRFPHTVGQARIVLSLSPAKDTAFRTANRTAEEAGVTERTVQRVSRYLVGLGLVKRKMWWTRTGRKCEIAPKNPPRWRRLCEAAEAVLQQKGT